jgi:hypothetical protein
MANWTILEEPDMSWLEKKKQSFKWQCSCITRKVKQTGSIYGGIKAYLVTRQKVKASSKWLMQEAEFIRNAPMHAPPELEEVLEFQNWATSAGMKFRPRIQRMPKHLYNDPEIMVSSTMPPLPKC